MIVVYSFICALLTAGYLLLLLYLIKGWFSLKRPLLKTGGYTTKVTVMIAARNEAERIHLTIEDILAQDYPKDLTEIIIVDDHSTDDTAKIIAGYADRGVKLLQLNEAEPLNSYKKKAIAKAIGLSNGDLMVATDADCRMGQKWLSSIVGYFEAEQPVMISSPVSYFEEQSLFERLQTLEFSYLIGVGAAFIGNKRAWTCNGANLAYRKDIFYEVGGFSGIDELASGDDELLLQKVTEYFPGKIGFLKTRDAIVYTHAKHTLSSFLSQRRRWASKSTKYKDKKVVGFALLIWFFNISILLNLLLGIFSRDFLNIFFIQFGLKCLIEVIYLVPICAFFKRTELLRLFMVVAPMHIIYMAYLGLMGPTRKYEWKGRMVK